MPSNLFNHVGPHYGRIPRSDTLRGLKAVELAREYLHHNVVAKGGKIYTTDSRQCACGKPALRVWKDKAWCKACYTKR